MRVADSAHLKWGNLWNLYRNRGAIAPLFLYKSRCGQDDKSARKMSVANCYTVAVNNVCGLRLKPLSQAAVEQHHQHETYCKANGAHVAVFTFL